VFEGVSPGSSPVNLSRFFSFFKEAIVWEWKSGNRCHSVVGQQNIDFG
jgi:hypothetical protein